MTVIAIVPFDAIHTGITNNWVRTKPAILRGLAPRLDSYCQILCLGSILDFSVGMAKTWAKIGWAYFEKITRTTRRCCEQAINQLLEDGVIRRRKAQVGTGWEYALAVRSSGDGESNFSKCRNCGQTDDIELDLDFIPVPHSFFRDLPAACDRGMYLIMMAVAVRTLRMDKETKDIVSVPCEITVDEFSSITGLQRAEILSDLQKLHAAGFLASERRGRSVFYWTKPENFAKGQARPVRVVHQPADRKRKGETAKAPKVDQPTDPKQSIRPVEFVTIPCGYCRHCNVYGPMDLVSTEQNSLKKTVGSANGTEERARGAPYSGKISKIDLMAKKLRDRYA